jgi:hypothetical protein
MKLDAPVAEMSRYPLCEFETGETATAYKVYSEEAYFQNPPGLPPCALSNHSLTVVARMVPTPD